MTIRRVSIGDAVAIATVHVKTWKVTHRGIMPDAVPDRMAVDERPSALRKRLRGEGADFAHAVHAV
jgi:hypothetical protein